MKALLLTQEFPPGQTGGIVAYYYYMCRELGRDIMVLTPHEAQDRSFDHVQPFAIRRVRMPVQPLRLVSAKRWSPARWLAVAYIAVAQILTFAWHSWRLLRVEAIPYLMVGHLYLAPVGRLIAFLSRRRYVVILHGGELHRFWRWAPVRTVMVWGMNGATFLVANSHHTQKQARERGVRDDLPIHVVAPGVDAARFAASGAAQAQTATQPRPLLLTVARLVEWKGQDTVIRALPQIVQEFPEVCYRIAGTGPYRGELEQLAARCGVSQQVEFVGFVADADLPDAYAEADVIVLPSREFRPGIPVEGFGITLMEAAAAGKPVVAGNLGGTQDSVVDGVTGLLVDPYDVHAVAEAILRLLRHPDKAARMGAAGQARAAQFDWPRQAASLRQLLEG